MNLLEALLYSFFDTFMAVLALPIQSHIAIVAIKIFASFSFPLVCIAAIFGAIIANLVNWLIGKLFIIAFKFKLTEISPEKKIVKICHKVQDKYYWLLLLSFLPQIGAFIVMFMAAASVNFRKAAILVIISNVIYYTLFFIL